jgi:hypothetical protein
MSPSLRDALIILGAVIVLVAILTWLAVRVVMRNYRAEEKHWGDLARRLGLNYEMGGSFSSQPQVTGTYRGYPMLLDAVTHRSGKSKAYWTRVVLRLDNRTNLDLLLYDGNPLERAENVLGVKYVLTGDDAFDRRFILQGNPEGLATFLVSSVRLRAELSAHPHVRLRVQKELMSYEMRGIEIDQMHLQAVIDMLVELSAMIEGAMANISLN